MIKYIFVILDSDFRVTTHTHTRTHTFLFDQSYLHTLPYLGLVKLWLVEISSIVWKCPIVNGPFIFCESLADKRHISTQRWRYFTFYTFSSDHWCFCCCGQSVKEESRSWTTWPAALCSNCSTPDTTSVCIPTMSNMAQVTSRGYHM